MLLEKITEKEKIIREQLERLRKTLNDKRIIYNSKPQDWEYITYLSQTEKKLEELFEFFESSPKA